MFAVCSHLDEDAGRRAYSDFNIGIGVGLTDIGCGEAMQARRDVREREPSLSIGLHLPLGTVEPHVCGMDIAPRRLGNHAFNLADICRI